MAQSVLLFCGSPHHDLYAYHDTWIYDSKSIPVGRGQFWQEERWIGRTQEISALPTALSPEIDQFAKKRGAQWGFGKSILAIPGLGKVSQLGHTAT
jgi:hypothetical protein